MNELENEERSWWSRNWKWVVPVGGCFTVILLGIILIGGAFFSFFSAVKSGSGGDEAFEIAQNNTKVIEALGEPIEKGTFGSNYNVKYNNGHKTTEATIPINGPNGEATLTVKTSGSDDDKVYEVFEIQLENTGEIIDLRENQLDVGDY
ncbi:cytochrome oxidase complex assembly protein 1 [Leeuwenhoekiella aestuarii]|uniref:Cytochrome oxidase complex assembly protein 1 n=1 Tax=Leeuwenhoekiella aestuarii TaxID=2249426 RepID=A0A4Q0P0Q8_9FLAO|nr:cytochrome c oxidase assembly factor Coa1 family protein [Leeuwenhoekiella aestuarii]RXG18176.1 cytochrome oxidase complex assembly protein 1 [Leeuwenhoekiella aestuarii]RXG19481.1 cytochrome oxidase complex assembly protein 1 [Leeuwenhoekiella aestuarii]